MCQRRRRTICCKGEQIGYTDLKSPEQKALLQKLIGMASTGMSQGATPYKGKIAAGIDPLMMMAANIMSNYGSGKNYTGTPTMGMPSAWYGAKPSAGTMPWSGGGGGTTNPGTPLPPGTPSDLPLPPPNATAPWNWQNQRPVNNPGWRRIQPI